MIERKILLENRISLNVRYSDLNRQKPILLLLHFSGGTSWIWNGVIPYLQNEYDLIIPDLRGHGKSDRPEASYHIDDMARDLFLLLKELHVDHCHVIGSSLGAEVGLSLAAANPDLVASLVCEGALTNEFGKYGLMEGTDLEIQQEKQRLRHQLAERKEIVFPNKEEFVLFYKKPLEEQGLWNRHFLTFIENNMEETGDGCYVHFYKNQVRNEYMESYWDLKFEEYYKHIECPILFMPSEEEWGNPRIRHNLNHFASFVKTSKITLIEQSLHAYVWMQMPGKAAAAVTDFLEEQLRST
jgi:pimeloyl-ACP methyl ester carboxylesterase